MLNSSLDLSFIRYSPLIFVCAGGKWTTSNTSLRLANSSAYCLSYFGSSMPSSLMGRECFGGSLSSLILWASIRSCSRLLGILFNKTMKLSMISKLVFNCEYSDAVNCITPFLKRLWLPTCLNSLNSCMIRFILASHVTSEVVLTERLKFGVRLAVGCALRNFECNWTTSCTIMSLFLEHSDSVCQIFDDSVKLLLNYSKTEMLWGNQEWPSRPHRRRNFSRKCTSRYLL